MELINKAQIIVEFTQDHFSVGEYEDFFEYNDLGTPLAIAIAQEMANLTDSGREVLEETWRNLCELFDKDETLSYESIDELIDEGFESNESGDDPEDNSDDGRKSPTKLLATDTKVPEGIFDKAKLIVTFTERNVGDDVYADFFNYNDLGIPLAVALDLGYVNLLPSGVETIDETWDDLCLTLNADPNGSYRDLEELVRNASASGPNVDIQLSINWNNDGHKSFMSGDADRALHFWSQASLFGQPNAITSLLWLNLMLNRFDERKTILTGYLDRTNNWRAQYDALVGDPAIGASQFDAQRPAAYFNSALMAWLEGDRNEAMAFLQLSSKGAEPDFLRKLIDEVPVEQMGLDKNQVAELIDIYEKAIENFQRIKSFDASLIQAVDGKTFVQFARESIENLKSLL